ncbi:ras-related GTP-binding protein C-like [Anneissia japonica]|uniref:ras-related GTP-binding protein C-like n=1 Tax=Anneissia japonica TaxID=1529436 RepID=UPI001425AA9C|nr:ras-related GTP-binding protein C-like [Anneissia japonica]
MKYRENLIQEKPLGLSVCTVHKRETAFLGFVKDESENQVYDSESSSIIKLNNATILYLKEVNKFLALVCILREGNFDRQGIIDYNFLCFKKAIEEVFEVRLQTQAIDVGSSAMHSPIESVMLDNPQTNGIGTVSKSS